MTEKKLPQKKQPNQMSLSLARYRRREGLPAVSLFSGAGGLDLGIESAGNGQIKFCSWVEKSGDARETLKLNGSHVKHALFEDICDVSPAAMMAEAGLEREETFLVAGGPPCQAFSTAGLRQSVNEERGQVVEHYFDIIRRLRPRFFVFENVRGLLSVAIQHRNYVERMESQKRDPGEPDLPDEQRLGSVFKTAVLGPISRLGYEVVFGLVNTADYGSAQSRHRLLVFGSRDKEFGSGKFRKITGREMTALDLLPATHHRFAPYPPIQPWRTLKDAIYHLAGSEPNPDDTYTYSEARRKIWQRIPAGAYWVYIRDHPELFPEGLPYILKGALTSGGGKVGFWRRLSWDKPSPTLPTQPQHLATGLCHPDFERPLSIPEYAALQDFPPEYQFSGNKTSRYEQIGNAVPVRLGRAIGNLLLSVAAASSSNESIDEADDEQFVEVEEEDGRTKKAS